MSSAALSGPLGPSAEHPLDCVIVGAGPAGLAAGIYLQRFHRRVLLLDSGASRALKIDRSLNCPGFPDGIAGAELLERLRRQLGRFGGAVVTGEVCAITRRDDSLIELRRVQCRLPYLSRTVILCTGVRDVVPLLPGVDEVRAAGRLRQCPICDGHEHSGQRIGVLGHSAHAEREAGFLRDYGAEVSLVRLEGGTPAPVATGLDIDAGLVRVTMSDGSTVRFDVLYAALGSTPQTGLAQPLHPTLDGQGNVVVDASCRTSVDGLFAAGDVVSALDQIAVAMGQGAVAATAVHNLLRELRIPVHGA